MLSGTILDVYPDYHQNVMVVWLVHNGKATRVQDRFTPSFLVAGSSMQLSSLASQLYGLPAVKQLNFVTGKTVLGSAEKVPLLEVTPTSYKALGMLAQEVDRLGGFQTYQLFNVDLRLPTRYLLSKGVFCHAQVNWTGTGFELRDEQWSVDYELPVLKTMHLNIVHRSAQRLVSFHDPVQRICLDDTVVEEENEADTILSAARELRRMDPDVVMTQRGDSVLFPYLYHRAGECGVLRQLNLGREKQQRFTPAKQAKSYMSYGQILYRPAFYTLQGRLHLDTYHSFFYGESGLRGLFDVARCSSIPVQMVSRLGPGTVISQIQVNKALEKGYVVPWKKNQPEQWKTAKQLLVCDRGGMILDPVIGLHENVVELDYASLYPNIMVKHNISPETIGCSCCLGSAGRVPGLGYYFCEKQKGLLPEVLEPIISRRFCFKARARNKQYDPVLYTELQKAWKWVLIVCFGYTGYRNARYGKIECYESISAYSRDILLTAMAVAQDAGYEVLHGIIDSLWIQPTSGALSAHRLARRIATRTGVRLEVEAEYRWIVFLPSKVTGSGVLNRYYGVRTNGEVKIRGIEVRQRNTPEFFQCLQKEMLGVLASARTGAEVRKQIPEALMVMQRFAKRIRKGNVDANDLVFTTRISRDVTEYAVQTLAKAALLQLRDSGFHTEPGQSVRFIVTNTEATSYKDRVRIAEFLTGSESIDKTFYLRQIAKCAESILVPFGYTVKMLQKQFLVS